MKTSQILPFAASLIGYASFLALACLGGENTVPPSRAQVPNVVLIVVDTLRADALTDSRDGRPLMPKLRLFAEESMWYTNATSQASWTKPAMVSLFTSLYPEVHNVQFGLHAKITPGQSPAVDCLPDAIPTMATCFREAGYRTVAVQSNSNLKAQFGFDQGFDSYHFYPYPKHRGDTVTEQAVQALAQTPSPSFVYVHYMDPHHPYDPPSSYRDASTEEDALTKRDRDLLASYGDYYLDKVLTDVGVHDKRVMGQFSDVGKAHVRALYDGEVRFTDDLLGELIDHIRLHSPNTIIIVTADHGEEFWEHGSVGHGKTVFEELVHVPLIVSMPGGSPQHIEAPVETIDLLPTLATLLGWPPDPAWQGADLLALSREQTDAPRATFSSTRTSLRESNVDLQSIAVWPEKLVYDAKSGDVALYNLAADKTEQQDRAPAEPEVVSRLQAALREHQEKLRRHPLASTDTHSVPLDAQTLEEMEAIGYLDGGSRPHTKTKP